MPPPARINGFFDLTSASITRSTVDSERCVRQFEAAPFGSGSGAAMGAVSLYRLYGMSMWTVPGRPLFISANASGSTQARSSTLSTRNDFLVTGVKIEDIVPL